MCICLKQQEQKWTCNSNLAPELRIILSLQTSKWKILTLVRETKSQVSQHPTSLILALVTLELSFYLHGNEPNIQSESPAPPLAATLTNHQFIVLVITENMPNIAC